MPRAYYTASIQGFLAADADAILGILGKRSEGDIEQAQMGAWGQQIPILKAALQGIDGAIHLEFVVPESGVALTLSSSWRMWSLSSNSR